MSIENYKYSLFGLQGAPYIIDQRAMGDEFV